MLLKLYTANAELMYLALVTAWTHLVYWHNVTLGNVGMVRLWRHYMQYIPTGIKQTMQQAVLGHLHWTQQQLHVTLNPSS